MKSITVKKQYAETEDLWGFIQRRGEELLFRQLPGLQPYHEVRAPGRLHDVGEAQRPDAAQDVGHVHVGVLARRRGGDHRVGAVFAVFVRLLQDAHGFDDV